MQINDSERRSYFLECLCENGNVTESAKLAGIPRTTLYDWRRADEDFARAWEEANELGTDALEDEATRRGKDGVDEPIFYKGSEVAQVKRYSDTLLMFMLKARRPDKFKDRSSTEITGKDGGPLIQEITIEHHGTEETEDPAALGSPDGGSGERSSDAAISSGTDAGLEVEGAIPSDSGGDAVGENVVVPVVVAPRDQGPWFR